MTKIKAYQPWRKQLFGLPLLMSLTFASGVAGQSDQNSTSGKIITPDNYDRWESSRGGKLSSDGNWISVEISNRGGDYKLLLRDLQKEKDTLIMNSSNGVFSEDGKWFLYVNAVPGEEVKKLRKSKKPIPLKYTLVDLSSWKTVEFQDADNFQFSPTGNYLAYKKGKDKNKVLLIKNLDTQKEVSFGNVEDFAWKDETDLLAMTLSSSDKEANALQLFDLEKGILQVLDKEPKEYSGLRWVNEGETLVVLTKVEDDSYEEVTFNILTWNDPQNATDPVIFDQKLMSEFPEGYRVMSDNLRFSEDGKRVFFNIMVRNEKVNTKDKEQEEVAENNADHGSVDPAPYTFQYEEAPAVDVWNSKDRMTISQQKASSYKSSRTPQLCVWFRDNGSMKILEDELTERINLQVNNDRLIGYDGTPYDFEAMFGRPSTDIYLVEVNSGEKKKLLEDVHSAFTVDPKNRYFVYLKDDALHLYDLQKESSLNVTEGLNISFTDHNNDHPVPQQPAYGFGGWFENGKSCLLYSEFDVWQLSVNGKMKRLTDGAASGIVYRDAQYRYSTEPLKDKDPIFFSMFNENDKSSGLAKLKKDGTVRTLIYEPESVGFGGYDEDNDMITYSRSTYEKAPDIYVADSDFKSSEKITALNPFQSEFAWGKAELVRYTNAMGKEAQGVLYYPANYEKGKKYPMITYIYEKLSRNLHRYITPAKNDYYNTTIWVQNGYFVFNPDIEFEAGNPGVSSTRNLELAVASIVEKGDVDEEKVGLIGHSWGGYQAGFVPTQTDIFAACVAGAGLTDLISMNLAITPGFRGAPENNHFEVGQERMEVAPWVDADRYLKNSSVMQIEKLNTPLLFEVGDNDTNVNWSQGLAYYNAARRAGKDFVLLVYAKEGHGLREDKNRIDYQQRILQWFGHYLKGEPSQDWMVKSVPYDTQQTELKKTYK
ncbi:alpha/beta hydrolase family protein [Robertkochia solimangrovi]|uniref:alpha/beta hydrolase family protein n=1 Tax=Robertkochia solimangrovi TaxID=2213046 RepID=UPI00117F07AE|nr:prolyl oligopeptidase family serine peptidase [Robertkochia solimangrovi]TRZ43516.1 hypothetical protein DMZ48_08805 [Robertkochia solimangrovi]